MSDIKIYVSLPEVESLVFNGFLKLSNSRLDVERAQASFSVAINLSEAPDAEFQGNLLILFSQVEKFEIPVKEENLFKNHYNLPLGLLELKSRKVRDEHASEPELTFDLDQADDNFLTQAFPKMRNGLLFLYKEFVSKGTRSNPLADINSLVKSLESLTAFRQALLKEYLSSDEFPILSVKSDDFKPDWFYRYAWFGKLAVESLLVDGNNESPDELKKKKGWFRLLFDPADQETINKAIADTPKELEGELDILIGYYIAITQFDKISKSTYAEDIGQIATQFDLKNTEIVYSWALFFIGGQLGKKRHLFFIPAFRQELIKLEKLSFEILSTNFAPVKGSVQIETPKLKREEALLQYFALQEGDKKGTKKMISDLEANEILESKLSTGNLLNCGFEVTSEFEGVNLPNRVYKKGNALMLKLSLQKDMSKITFFLGEDSELKLPLKSLKVKTKHLKGIIPTSKRILFFVLKGEIPKNSMIYLYSLVIPQIDLKFDKIICLWRVNVDPADIHSPEFDLKKHGLADSYRKIFMQDLSILVKNDRHKNDGEIRRNLKNILSDFNTEQVEVIDEHIDEGVRNWLIDATKNYCLAEEEAEYSVVIKD